MTRPAFLTFNSVVAFAVACFALGFPQALLAGKGVEADPARIVWVREVGALIFASGLTIFLIRNAPDSRTLRGVLLGNAVLHLTLFPIELIAFAQGTITNLAGVVPNSLLHALLAVGFLAYAKRLRLPRGGRANET